MTSARGRTPESGAIFWFSQRHGTCHAGRGGSGMISQQESGGRVLYAFNNRWVLHDMQVTWLRALTVKSRTLMGWRGTGEGAVGDFPPFITNFSPDHCPTHH